MKKLTITAKDSDVGTIINALAGAYATITIETIAAEVAKSPKAPIMRPRQSPIRDAVLTLKNKNPEGVIITRAEIDAAVTDAGGSASSSSPTVSRLVRDGLLERVGKAGFRFTEAPPP